MADIRIVTVTLNPALDRVLEAADFAVGKHAPAKRLSLYPAGKGINVSRVLARLGCRSVATGFIGQSELQMFEEHLERTGFGRIVTQLLVVRGATRDNITIVDPINDTETHIREQGFDVQRDDVARMTSKLAMLSRQDSIIAFSGSLPPGVSTTDFLEMVRRCRRQGALVCVDTSRAGLEALRGQELWLVKVNAEELATLADRPTNDIRNIGDAARALARRHGGPVQNVVVTLGADGAILINDELEVRAWAPVHPGLVVSTVGCGDSLLAGMFAMLGRSRGWEESLREGIASATANALQREAGHVDPDIVSHFRELVEIEPLDAALERSQNH